MEDLKIDPTILGCFGKVVFLDELLWDIRELDAHIFGSLHWGLEVKVFKSKETKRALRRGRTLLMMSFTRSSEPVGVPTSPG